MHALFNIVDVRPELLRYILTCESTFIFEGDATHVKKRQKKLTGLLFKWGTFQFPDVPNGNGKGGGIGDGGNFTLVFIVPAFMELITGKLKPEEFGPKLRKFSFGPYNFIQPCGQCL